jgi:hypothetical protein
MSVIFGNGCSTSSPAQPADSAVYAQLSRITMFRNSLSHLLALVVLHFALQGGLNNVISMFLYLAEEQLAPAGLPPPPPPQETPQTGCLHPAKPGYYWSGPADYMAW